MIDDDNIDSTTRDSIRSSAQSQVGTQDCERDILLRYKDALRVGIASCKDHFRKKWPFDHLGFQHKLCFACGQ